MATEAMTPIHCPGCQTVYDPGMIDTVEMAFCPKCRFPLSLIAGKYRLERLINQGGFGMLYLARHIGLDMFNERVIKVLKPELFTDPDVLRRFRREVQLTANLSEQNNHIVRIYDDFGEAPELGQYYVMEYLRGLTLDAMQEHRQPMEYELAFHIFFQLCRAMGASHRAGVIHRDLKPDNIFLIQRDADPHFVKVIDFGLARPAEGHTQVGDFATHQQVMGTPAYMAPEQCQGEAIDHRCDIYAMGILLYQMLTGHHPYPINPSDTMALFFAHISGTPTPLENYLPDAPTGLGETVLQALAKQPEDRYIDAEAFWKALAPYADGDVNHTLAPRRASPGLAAGADENSLDPLAFDATAAGLPAVPDDVDLDLPAHVRASDHKWQTPTSSHSTDALRHDAAGQGALPRSGGHDPFGATQNDARPITSYDPSDAFPPNLLDPNDLDLPLTDATIPLATPSTVEISEELSRHYLGAAKSGEEDLSVHTEDSEGDETLIAGVPAPDDLPPTETETADDKQPKILDTRAFEETVDNEMAKEAIAMLKAATSGGAAPSIEALLSHVEEPSGDEESEDGDTSISTFTPPQVPEDEDTADDPLGDDDGGDTSISTAPAFAGLNPTPAPETGHLQELAAIPEAALEALPELPKSTGTWRGANTQGIIDGAPKNRSTAVATATSKDTSGQKRRRHSTEDVRKKPPGKEALRATSRIPRTPRKTPTPQETPTPPPTSEAVPWAVWIGVGLAVMAIVAVGVWLLSRV